MSDDLRDIHKQDQEDAMREAEVQRQVIERLAKEMEQITQAHIRRRQTITRVNLTMMVVVISAATLALLLPALALAWRWFHLK